LVGLSYLYWWSDEKDLSLARLRQAVDLSQESPGVMFDLAGLLSVAGDADAALATLDKIPALDQRTLARREWAALEAALKANGTGRAREAAERLFGLQLTADEQVRLAPKLQQLGMRELAEAVLRRARRRSGGSVDRLAEIMQQFQAQGDHETAVEVACQILRRPPAPGSSRSSYYTAAEAARERALQLVAGSDKLDELIGRAEAQLARSPDSVTMLRILADYYVAAKRADDARKVYDKLTSLHPGDAAFRYRIALILSQAGQHDAAIGQYRLAMKEDPALYARYYNEIQQAFERAGRLADLVDLVRGMDMAKAHDPYVFTRLVSSLVRNSRTRDQGLELFDKVWEAFPSQRPHLLSYLSSSAFRSSPRLYEYLHQAIMQAAAGPPTQSWTAMTSGMSYSSSGKMSNNVVRLLDMAETQKKLEGLRQEVESALEKSPGWVEGKALAAMIAMRLDDPEKARALVEPLLKSHEDGSAEIPPEACALLAQELDADESLRPLATVLYEKAVDRLRVSRELGYQYGPAQRLVALYKEQDRVADARALLLKFAGQKLSRSSDPAYNAREQVRNGMEISRALRSIGFPLDAFQLCRDLLPIVRSYQADPRFGGRYSDQLGTEMKQALRETTPEAVMQSFLQLAADAEESSGSGSRTPATIDLMLSVASVGAEPTLTSPFVDAFAAAASSADQQEPVAAALAELVESRPHDVSALVAAALGELAWGTSESKRSAVARLVQWAEDRPLAPLEPGRKPNFRQQEEAEAQVCLWLVARRCLADDALATQGRPLADRVVEAVRRQTDTQLLQAVLAEAGRLALKRGDRDQAEALWGRLLPTYLGRQLDGPKPKAMLPATVEEFNRCAGLAERALDGGLDDLSLGCVRESLRPGWPVSSRTPTGSAAAGTIQLTGEDRPNLIATLVRLSGLWEERGVSPAAVYEMMAEIVFPESRPKDVFIVQQGLGGERIRPIDSLGRLLIEWADRADRLEDLRQRIAARQKQGGGLLNLWILRTQLATTTEDAALATKGINWLAARIQSEGKPWLGIAAMHAVAPAVQKQWQLEKVAPLVELASGVVDGATGRQLLGELRRSLSRQAFQQGDFYAGTRHLYAYRNMLEAGHVGAEGDQGHTERQLLELGAALAHAGRCADAMAILGYFAELQAETEHSHDLTPLARQLWRLLENEPPAERYRVLKPLVFPGEGFQRVRQVGFLEPGGLLAHDQSGAGQVGRGLVSFSELLVDSAQREVRLDELEVEVRRASEHDPANAETLLALVNIAQGQAKAAQPHLESLLAEMRVEPEAESVPSLVGMLRSRVNQTEWGSTADSQGKRISGEEPGARIPWSAYLLTRAALADESLRPLGEKLAAALVASAEENPDQAFLSQLARRLEPGAAQGLSPGLAFWHPVVRERGVRRLPATEGLVWQIDQTGHRAVLAGAVRDFLYFDYPLAGTFEFSFEAFHARDGDAALAYGGVALDPADIPGKAKIWRIGGGRTQLWLPRQNDESGRFNRLTVRVSPDRVEYLCNDQPMFESQRPSPTSPWLVLSCRGDRGVRWRNFELRGNPHVPREVRLTKAEHLEGWTPGLNKEQMPSGPLLSGPHGQPAAKPSPDDHDWCSIDGVIHGRRLPAEPPRGPVQSWLAYHRPMRGGETISYEFFYRPGEELVHPAIGRVAFELEPGGVRLHWITDSPHTVPFGMPADNAVEIAQEQRGPKRLPLEPGAWNSVEMSLDDDVLSLRLNDQLVYERPLRPSNSRLFGLFHYRNRTAVRVRNVLLRGDWPERLAPEQMAGPALATKRELGSF
jgi:tetratricopeptide (TPR) repeat protein